HCFIYLTFKILNLIFQVPLQHIPTTFRCSPFREKRFGEKSWTQAQNRYLPFLFLLCRRSTPGIDFPLKSAKRKGFHNSFCSASCYLRYFPLIFKPAPLPPLSLPFFICKILKFRS